MMLRTCLLISDDPDDHTEFSEALYEIADDAVLVTVSNLKRAIDLLVSNKCSPEYIFLNLATGDSPPDALFDSLESQALKHVRIVVYGDTAARFAHPRIFAFLEGDFSYSELKTFLENALGRG